MPVSAVTLTNKTLTQSSAIYETIRIQSGLWNNGGMFIYLMLNHIKYALRTATMASSARSTSRCTSQWHTRQGQDEPLPRPQRVPSPSTGPSDSIEYRFELALVHSNYDEVLRIIKMSNLVGQSIIAYLQKKGFPEVIALHFIQDKNMCFDLVMECGNLNLTLKMVRTIRHKAMWRRLAQQALKQGDHKIVEKGYQQPKTSTSFFFLYLTTGQTHKLSKMQKIADLRGVPTSKFRNALYAGDVLSFEKRHYPGGRE